MANFYGGLSQGLVTGIGVAQSAKRDIQRQKTSEYEAGLAKEKLEYDRTQDALRQQNIEKSYGLSEKQFESSQKSKIIKNELDQLRMIQDDKIQKFKQEKELNAQQEFAYKNSMEIAGKYFAQNKNITDPQQQQLYNQNIKETDFFKKSPPEAQSIISLMSEMPIQQNDIIVKQMNDFYTAMGKNDIDNMQRIAIQASVQYGNTPNKSIQTLLNGMSSLAGLVPMKGQRTDISVSPEGGFTMSQGPAQEMGTTVKTDIEKKIINANNRLVRLNEIQESYDSELLTGMSHAKALGIDLSQKLLGKNLSGPQKKFMNDYTDLFQSTITELNKFVFELSGKATNKTEASRIKSSIPNIETGFLNRFLSDGPAVFKRKLDNVIRYSEEAQQRLIYAYEHGFIKDTKGGLAFYTEDGDRIKLSSDISNFKGVPIKSLLKKTTPSVNDIGDQLYIEMKNQFPESTDEELKALVVNKLRGLR